MRSGLRSSVVWVGLVVLLLLGAVPGWAPPAKALVAGTLTVAGTVEADAGIAYPCVGNGFLLIDLTKCLGRVSSGNTTAFTFTGSGLLTAGNVQEGSFLHAEMGTVTIVAYGTITGACGLSSGLMWGSLTADLPVPGTVFARTFNATFSENLGTVTVTGSTSNGETLAGELATLTDPTTGSCGNKASKEFKTGGELTLTRL